MVIKETGKSKRREKLRVGVFLLQDNAPIYTARFTVGKAANGSFELLPHPSYLEDLTPSVIFLFFKLQSHPCDRHFGNNEVICVVEEFLEDQDASFFCDRVAILEHCWTK